MFFRAHLRIGPARIAGCQPKSVSLRSRIHAPPAFPGVLIRDTLDGCDDLATVVNLAAARLPGYSGPPGDAVNDARAFVEGAQAAMANYEDPTHRLGLIDSSDMEQNAAELPAGKPSVRVSILWTNSGRNLQRGIFRFL